MMKFIYFMGVFNLIILSIRLVIGQVAMFFNLGTHRSLLSKIINLTEVIGVVWITFIIIKNYELIFTLL